MSYEALKFEDLVAHARQERAAFRSSKAHDGRSPACIELFRRSFGGDHEAWSISIELFQPLIKAWLLQTVSKLGLGDLVQIDAALYETYSAFFNSAPQHATLVSTENLSPLLDFLKKCAQTAVLRLRRTALRDLAREGRSGEIPLEQLAEVAAQTPGPCLDSQTRQAVWTYAEALLETEDERLVFELFFEQGLPPRKIVELHPARFAQTKEINRLVQRLKRRLEKDAGLREIWKRMS